MKKETRKKPISFEELRNQWKKDSEFKKTTYDSEIEYEIARQLILARINAGLSKEQMATRMGTTSTVIARLESGKSLPSEKTLSLYTKVLGRNIYVSIRV
jgi:ribosome-binding protein aMBF1 (putative translation factor)